MVCSCHFRPEDFDRTGQTVRIRDAAVPSIFKFSEHIPKPECSASSETSKTGEQCPTSQSHSPAKWPSTPPCSTSNPDVTPKAADKCPPPQSYSSAKRAATLPSSTSGRPMTSKTSEKCPPQQSQSTITKTATVKPATKPAPLPSSTSSVTSKTVNQCPSTQSYSSAKQPEQHPASEHLYCLDPVKMKIKLDNYQSQVERLTLKLQASRKREKRLKRNMVHMTEQLKRKHMLTEELKEQLDYYADLPVELLKAGNGFTSRQREFALTLYQHGPKAYNYLRDEIHIPLPHPHTVQRWTTEAKAGINDDHQTP
ncbi:uncharacterized protein LOC134455866 [Engraulis encrasicolus]|uniref:uncharacterized protein LOC134455866 n=1 Tax=Engraulis encrasicolus TaxID=184585 RepID=UPI002FD33EB4